MKKNIFRMAAISAACVLSLAGCQKTEVEPKNDFAVTFTLSLPEVEAETKTAFHNNVIWWTDKDMIRFTQYATVGGALKSTYATMTLSGTGSKLPTKTINFTAPDEGTKPVYFSVFPNSAYAAITTKDGVVYPRMTLKDVQTPSLDSFDPEADILISEYVVADAGQTEFLMRYARPNAFAKMSLKNIALAEGDAVATAKFSAIKGGKDAVLAGCAFFDLVNGTYSNLTNASCTKLPVITLDYSELAPAEDFTAYFICRPFELAAGDSFKVEVTTKNGAKFIKNVTLSSSQKLAFKANHGSVFSVDFAGITAE